MAVKESLDKLKERDPETGTSTVESIGLFSVWVSAYLAAVLFLVFESVVNALVLRHVWNVIVPPVFGDTLPTLSFWAAAGLSVVGYCFTVKIGNLATKEDVSEVKSTQWEKLRSNLMIYILRPLIVVLLASFIASQIATGG